MTVAESNSATVFLSGFLLVLAGIRGQDKNSKDDNRLEGFFWQNLVDAVREYVSYLWW